MIEILLKQVDQMSVNPGKQIFEKMISGKWTKAENFEDILEYIS